MVAAGAPAAVVLRRGPTGWWHLLHWDLARLTLTGGAWFHGTLYPRRCDISPDGRLLGYFARKANAAGPPWPGTYFAVSRPPWLEALAAWETCGTWTWGCQFSADGALAICACLRDQPFHGSYPRPVAILPMRVDWPQRDLWNEVKRGWQCAGEGDPAAALAAPPDLVMRREPPGGGGGVTLGLLHRGVDFAHGGMEGVQVEYFLQHQPGDVTPLAAAAWADWDHQGRLLMATREGTLEVLQRDGARFQRIWSEDLRGLTPQPEPAPAWAGRW